MRRFVAILLTLLASGVSLADEQTYSCSLKVGNPVRDSSMEKSNDNGNNRGVKTKTTRQKVTWPVTVSFLGKAIPQSGIVLKFYCLGMTDEVPSVLETKDIAVTLDEKGKFKTDLVSPTVTLTKTKRQRNNRNRNGDGGGSTVKGQRVSGCIVQLVVGDKVERVFTSKPTWAKLAKQNPIPSDELDKLR